MRTDRIRNQRTIRFINRNDTRDYWCCFHGDTEACILLGLAVTLLWALILWSALGALPS